ncbi:MAG: IPT/TIG domain-containing protein [Pyrinomonadaceae bacterium]|nr:IPT/TIG domain-containing protein [Pyrinomonadaceae bacterium]MBP6212881.1 IPT/TIG domain-containing protein [Pyrinomonadaceae bacterium]
MRSFIFLLIITTLISIPVRGQRQSVFVAPQATDPAISTNLNNHYVSFNGSTPSKGQLFVFLPGTGGVAFNYLEINNTAAYLGFHAVNLNYPNDDAVNSLCGGTNSDLNCYGKIRMETVDGTDRSPLVNVNRANSIENRLIKLLIYLRNTYPALGWQQFLTADSQIDWSKIVIAGHSQGGGHAGIIGRYHGVSRVLMFAAMDFNALSNAPANWIAVPDSTPNATGAARFWGFGHQQDEMVNFTLLSTRIWPAYGMPQYGSIQNADNTSPPYANSHSLTSSRACDNYHGCIAADIRLVLENGVPVYKPVWEYMLSQTSPPSAIGNIAFERFGAGTIRPTVGISTKGHRLVLSGTGFAPQSAVYINGSRVPSEFSNANIIKVSLPAGKFGAVGATKVEIRDADGTRSNTVIY